MKNNKYNIILVMFLFLTTMTFGQDPAADANAADANAAAAPADANNDAAATADQNPIQPTEPPNDIGNLPVVNTNVNPDTLAGSPRAADEKFVTILIDSFEIPQGWYVQIPLDFGISKILYRDAAHKPLASDTNKVVLGVKTIFFRRNYGWMSIDRPYPLILNNFVRQFAVWVVGRNLKHVFSFKIRDIDYNRYRLSAGEMNFQGWKQMKAGVPDHVVQYNPIRRNKGLDFLGFQIDFVAQDTSTLDPYYLYLDQFTSDISLPTSTVADDVSDDW